MSNGDVAAAILGSAAYSARMGVLAPIMPWFPAVSGAVSDSKMLYDGDLR
jgi:hypothetical protein